MEAVSKTEGSYFDQLERSYVEADEDDDRTRDSGQDDSDEDFEVTCGLKQREKNQRALERRKSFDKDEIDLKIVSLHFVACEDRWNLTYQLISSFAGIRAWKFYHNETTLLVN